MAREKRFTKKEWSWIFYDWANSIYATNIMAAIYPAIFASTVPGGDIRWGYGTSIATFLVAILAPFLGAVADYKGMKKKLFVGFALMGILFTPLMALMGSWKLMLVGYVISRVGFSGANLFYDSFLTDVTTDERMDRVSSWGFAMGYIGGSTIPFLISIGMLLIFGFDSAFARTFSVVIVSVWWAAFSIPMLLNVKQEHYIESAGRVKPKQIFINVFRTAREIFVNKGLFLFVVAYFFYIDGVDTVISISTAYGTTLGLGMIGMILALLVTQIVAMPSSILFAKLAEKFTARRAILGAVCVYLVICVLGFYMGFSMEPSQAAYEKMVDDTTAPYAERIDKDAFDEFVREVKPALRSDDAQAELANVHIDAEGLDQAKADAYTETENEMKLALLSAADANKDKVVDFKSAIGFSSVLFWVMACMVGTVQGGIQAVSRSYFGKLVPKNRSNEFFGFFDIFGKFACVIGPALYALIASATGRSSYGVLGLAVLFLSGLIILLAGGKRMDETVGKVDSTHI